MKKPSKFSLLSSIVLLCLFAGLLIMTVIEELLANSTNLVFVIGYSFLQTIVIIFIIIIPIKSNIYLLKETK